MSEIKVNSIKGVGASAAAITVNNTDGTCTANLTSISGGQLSNRNKVINGSMIIHQRGGSLTGNEYTLDRFKIERSTDGAYTVSQSTESPDDFSNSLHVNCTTADTSVASGQYLQLKHSIEGQNLQDLAKGTSTAKKTVLSFYVKTNLTGTYAVSIYDADNTRLFATTYTVSNTNWNRYTIDIPADTTGALNNDNGSSIELYWSLVQGSSRTSGSASTSWGSYALANFAVGHNVNFLGSTDNNWYLTGVQFEKSDTGVATDFEHMSFGQELALCQRYCQVFGGVTNYTLFGTGVWKSSTVASIGFPFMTKMRSQPSFSVTSPTNSMVRSGGSNIDVTTVALDINTTENVMYNANASSGGTNGHGAMHLAKGNTDTTITLSAEL